MYRSIVRLLTLWRVVAFCFVAVLCKSCNFTERITLLRNLLSPHHTTPHTTPHRTTPHRTTPPHHTTPRHTASNHTAPHKNHIAPHHTTPPHPAPPHPAPRHTHHTENIKFQSHNSLGISFSSNSYSLSKHLKSNDDMAKLHSNFLQFWRPTVTASCQQSTSTECWNTAGTGYCSLNQRDRGVCDDSAHCHEHN